MRFGINVPNFGEYASPHSLVQLAIETERAGWDGFFVWDHIVIGNGIPVADPWVVLAAVAQVTESVAIGPMVTPVPRRRPWVLARQALTVDYLSDGRLILGVGTGFPADVEFGTFNEPTSDRERAEMLDEGLAIIQGIWSGEPFAYEGAHFQVRQTSFAPQPLRPIPIWVAGMWPNQAPFRRAARYNGAYPIADDFHRLSVAEISEIAAYLDRFRTGSGPYDIVIGGHRPSGRQVSEYEAAGVTWWMVGPAEGEPLAMFTQLVARGPGS
jgi:alkanesulfonate monooxygenase SsuD/methylene tetrahydromethanopterin reductase-like flavin-dependent oxidoreductase (luciferase family)